MEQVAINWFAVLGATLIGFVVGFLWYGPLFGKAWMKEIGMTDEEVKNGNMLKIFSCTLTLQFVMAFCLASFLGNDLGAVLGSLYGFYTGLGFVATALSVNALYEQKTWKYMMINGGFWVVVFTLMGIVIGLFN